MKAQRKLVAEAAEFLLINQIPQFVTDCVHLATAPTDGVALTGGHLFVNNSNS
jgi:hypothetical protein